MKKYKYKISIANIISILLVLAIAFCFIYSGWQWHQNVNNQFNLNCKHCSVFDKDCPWSDKELLDQEYGSGPCQDMGQYEMLWKLSAAIPLLGIGIIVMLIVLIYLKFKEIKKQNEKTNKKNKSNS